jgi:hypothetical protein
MAKAVEFQKEANLAPAALSLAIIRSIFTSLHRLNAGPPIKLLGTPNPREYEPKIGIIPAHVEAVGS